MWKRFNDLNSRFKKIKASPKSENEKKVKTSNYLLFKFNFNCKKNILKR